MEEKTGGVGGCGGGWRGYTFPLAKTRGVTSARAVSVMPEDIEGER